MKFLATVIMTLTCLQPLQYGIQSLIQLSRQRRTLYPLLRIKHPEGIQPFITMKGRGDRAPISSVCS